MCSERINSYLWRRYLYIGDDIDSYPFFALLALLRVSLIVPSIVLPSFSNLFALKGILRICFRFLSECQQRESLLYLGFVMDLTIVASRSISHTSFGLWIIYYNIILTQLMHVKTFSLTETYLQDILRLY